jgi:integrase
MAKSLTAAAVAKFRPGPVRREIPDAHGLILIVQSSGHKSWAMRFRRPDGKSAKLTLGPVDLSGAEAASEPVIGAPLTLSAARRLAAEVHRQRALGRDPVADYRAEKLRRRSKLSQSADNTFAAAARYYVEHGRKKRKRNRGWRATAQLLGLAYPQADGGDPEFIRGGLAERWREKPIAEITSEDIFILVDEAREKGVPGRPPRNTGMSDVRAREVATALSGMFRWLLDRRRIRSNPCIGIGKPKPPAARERVLNTVANQRGADELVWLWAACDAVGEPLGPMCKLLLLTGARRSEVAGMTRDELSDDLTTWSIPGTRTKNGRPHVVPLPPLAREILMSLPARGAYVFSTTGRTPVSGFSKMKQRLDRAMLAAAREKDEDAAVQPWRLHDLRRTFATGANEIGVAPHIVEACINHVSGARAGIAGTYNRAAHAEDKRKAMELWARHVQGIVSGRAAKNVVDLSRTKV